MDRVAGRAFNLGGGPANAVSLRQLIGEIEMLLGKRIDVSFSDWRAGDQRYYVSDTRHGARGAGPAARAELAAGPAAACGLAAVGARAARASKLEAAE